MGMLRNWVNRIVFHPDPDPAEAIPYFLDRYGRRVYFQDGEIQVEITLPDEQGKATITYLPGETEPEPEEQFEKAEPYTFWWFKWFDYELNLLARGELKHET